MPIFEYSCGQCNSVSDEIREIARRDDPFSCPYCGTVCQRITVPKTFLTLWGERCSDGKMIHTTMGPTQTIHPAGREQQRYRKTRKYRDLVHAEQFKGPTTELTSQGFSGQLPPEAPTPSTVTRTKKLDSLE